MNKLSVGNGLDMIHSGYLKHASNSLKFFLARLFSSFIGHCYMPEQMLYGEIKPTVKDKPGDKLSSDNYRPVMNSSNILKLFEYCILPRLKRHLKINNRQFGFRDHTGCSLALSVFKETVMSYTDANTNVHCAMLDLSKAFDKVNFNVLHTKLIKESSLPSPLIKIINFMNFNSNAYVKFNNVAGEMWRVGNGVRLSVRITFQLLF
jgi:hypothetical protein